MNPNNIRKELKWIDARAQNRIREGADPYEVEAERQFAKNQVLLKYGITFQDPSV